MHRTLRASLFVVLGVMVIAGVGTTAWAVQSNGTDKESTSALTGKSIQPDERVCQEINKADQEIADRASSGVAEMKGSAPSSVDS